MATLEYRGAGYVPIAKKTEFAQDKGKKDPRFHVWPGKKYIHKGEHVPVTRRKSNIYSHAATAKPAKNPGSVGGMKRRG